MKVEKKAEQSENRSAITPENVVRNTAVPGFFQRHIKNPIRRDVLQLAWPVLTELLLGSLFGMIDMMMLGRIADRAVSAASVAAVGITNQPLFLGLALAQALNVGGTAMVARYLGAKKTDRIESVLKHIILLNLLLLAIPVSLLGLTFTDQIMALMGAEADTITLGRPYFRIIMVGYVFQSFNMSAAAALRGVGETKTPMRINLRVNFLNVIGNAVLIYGLLFFPALGVTGAGISTAISHFLAMILLLRHFIGGKSILRLSLKSGFRFNRNIMHNLIRIGVPASLESTALRLGMFLFVRIVASLGTVVYASHQIAISILGLSFQPGQAFGITASSLVGRSLGAGQLQRAEEYAKETRRVGSVISTAMALLFFFFGEQIVGLYTTNPEIIRNSSTVLKIIALVQPFQSSQFILAGALRGAGDTLWTLMSTFVGVFGFRILIAYLLVYRFGFGLEGAWIAVLVDQLVRWGFVFTRFKSNKWKHVKIR